jgi:Ni/Fe-hydrogenase subunit HybB-like protein
MTHGDRAPPDLPPLPAARCSTAPPTAPGAFYAWMFVLTAIALVGANAWAQQVAHGMAVTGMSDHVSWGLYIANFTFAVGLAAGGVMMVIPAYLYHDEDMHDVVIIGELLAVAAIVMALGFVVVDLGRPDRFWHMLPFIGKFHWPVSMLTWDVIVLNGYLLLNLHVCGYLALHALPRRSARPALVRPLRLPLHRVGLLHPHGHGLPLRGLGGRPFWNSALLAPRFLASAFVTGPAFIVLTLQLVRASRASKCPRGPSAAARVHPARVRLVNLFMLGAELFTTSTRAATTPRRCATSGSGSTATTSSCPGSGPRSRSTSAPSIVLLTPRSRATGSLLNAALVATFAGVWIEKGMGLIVPGFIPSTLHELVPYAPTITEWKVTAGVWALGLMIFTVAIKVGLQAMTGELRDARARRRPPTTPKTRRRWRDARRRTRAHPHRARRAAREARDASRATRA